MRKSWSLILGACSTLWPIEASTVRSLTVHWGPRGSQHSTPLCDLRLAGGCTLPGQRTFSPHPRSGQHSGTCERRPTVREGGQQAGSQGLAGPGMQPGASLKSSPLRSHVTWAAKLQVLGLDEDFPALLESLILPLHQALSQWCSLAPAPLCSPEQLLAAVSTPPTPLAAAHAETLGTTSEKLHGARLFLFRICLQNKMRPGPIC